MSRSDSARTFAEIESERVARQRAQEQAQRPKDAVRLYFEALEYYEKAKQALAAGKTDETGASLSMALRRVNAAGAEFYDWCHFSGKYDIEFNQLYYAGKAVDPESGKQAGYEEMEKLKQDIVALDGELWAEVRRRARG